MPKDKSHADRMTPAQHKKFTKAVKDGVITKAQHDKLSAGLLDGIIKKKTRVRGGTPTLRKSKAKKAKKGTKKK
tara:strand:- start:200 stop:421 length:222 start_codon:yes stop_codon:yes gene_type:complete